MNKYILASAAAAMVLLAAHASTQQPPPAAPQQPSEIVTAITGDGGQPPRLAVPDFIAVSTDAESVAIARTISQVLWDDLNYEREFLFIPRDVYTTIPKATSFGDVPFDRWREVNADGLVIGTVQKTANSVRVEVRLFNVRNRQAPFAKVYTASGANPRGFAHMAADEIYQSQRALQGVAQTKLTFASDRDGERMSGTVEKRDVKEIYIADYDGENQRRVTIGRTLNTFPRWSPDGKSIAYTSYRRGGGQIFISNIYQGTMEEVTKGPLENWLAAWSPDGKRLCIASPREGKGHTNLYVVNRDGSGLRKLTDHASINTSPTWSPSGTQIAFVSDRTGQPQIYTVGVDGLGLNRVSGDYSDRPTWSPAPYNEIAFSARTGPGFDIRVIDMATRAVRQLTNGEGTNESPAFSPNGRHIAFTSTRSGKKQIFTVARDGRDVRQITRTGNNEQPDWK
jgi:TolB protein